MIKKLDVKVETLVSGKLLVDRKEDNSWVLKMLDIQECSRGFERVLEFFEFGSVVI